VAGEEKNKETAVNYNGSLALAIARAGDHKNKVIVIKIKI